MLCVALRLLACDQRVAGLTMQRVAKAMGFVWTAIRPSFANMQKKFLDLLDQTAAAAAPPPQQQPPDDPMSASDHEMLAELELPESDDELPESDDDLHDELERLLEAGLIA